MLCRSSLPGGQFNASMVSAGVQNARYFYGIPIIWDAIKVTGLFGERATCPTLGAVLSLNSRI